MLRLLRLNPTKDPHKHKKYFEKHVPSGFYPYNTVIMISKDLLTILCCPETRQELSVADSKVIDKINQRIECRELKTRGGGEITQKIEAGLVRSDRQYLYPVRQGIPVMLMDEAIPLAGIL